MDRIFVASQEMVGDRSLPCAWVNRCLLSFNVKAGNEFGICWST